MMEEEEEVSLQEWKALYEAVYNAYQNGTTYNGERIVRLELLAAAGQDAMRFETASGVRRRVYYRWRGFMR